MMRLGQLGLPLAADLTGQQTLTFNPIPTNAFYTFIRENHFGQEFKNKLLSDTRFRDIDGKMLSDGTGASKLEADHLAAWYAYRANEIGIERANRDLDDFLNADHVELLATVWVYGVTTQNRISLSESVELTPIREMPLSQERFDYQRLSFSRHAHSAPAPQTALTKTIKSPKILPDVTTSGPTADPTGPTKLANEALSELHNLCVLMNAIPGICSMPGYRTFYRKPHIPTHPFGGSGGGSLLFDMFPRKISEFNPDAANLLHDLAKGFASLSASSKMRIESALHRLAQAKGRFDDGDACLDLGIALEMVLLNTEHKVRNCQGN